MSGVGSREAGFTLLEILTVLALTAVIGAIAFPTLQQAVAAADIARARQQLASDLMEARGAALRTGAPVRLLVSDDGTAYRWGGEAPRRLSARLRLAAMEGPAPAFFGDGSASAARLVLSNGARTAALAVEPTGAISLVPTASGARP